ncbi:MAG TPA: 1-hydroxycarotenoid 3,4-desaturase CrtD [Polyangiaceae bacterium]|nr:1-hydroxycarotenoid 3,4-desaturase CrtD [Polyangiaceae bacterium]
MKAVVIGSGVAGLAAAIRLRVLGLDVEVYEANTYPGGKLTSLQVGDYRFDAGPSLFTMPELVCELFELAGRRASDYFQYEAKEVGCHYFFPDGTFLRAYTKPERLAAEVESVLGVPRHKTRAYLRHSAKVYELVGRTFMEKPLNRLATWTNPAILRAIWHLREYELNRTLHDSNVARLAHPKLVQYFDRMATYSGSNPYAAPAMLSVIPHLEHNVGTFVPKGGMHAITLSLYRLAQELGVTFQFDARVTRIITRDRRAIGVEIGARAVTSDVVVCNMDVAPAYRKLLAALPAPERILKQERSSSALIFYWGVRKSVPRIELHNVFFGEPYEAEFDAIFGNHEICDDPTVYVNATVKNVPEDAPAGCENWFVMVNAPVDIGQDWDAIVTRTRRSVLAKLERSLGEKLGAYIEAERVLDPRGIETRTSSYRGALYGASSNSKWAAFMRHPNSRHDLAALHFCGGSVHPGGGIPLCLNSARIAVQGIREELGL